jgi:hypothetical protein
MKKIIIYLILFGATLCAPIHAMQQDEAVQQVFTKGLPAVIIITFLSPKEIVHIISLNKEFCEFIKEILPKYYGLKCHKSYKKKWKAFNRYLRKQPDVVQIYVTTRFNKAFCFGSRFEKKTIKDFAEAMLFAKKVRDPDTLVPIEKIFKDKFGDRVKNEFLIGITNIEKDDFLSTIDSCQKYRFRVLGFLSKINRYLIIYELTRQECSRVKEALSRIFRFYFSNDFSRTISNQNFRQEISFTANKIARDNNPKLVKIVTDVSLFINNTDLITIIFFKSAGRGGSLDIVKYMCGRQDIMRLFLGPGFYRCIARSIYEKDLEMIKCLCESELIKKLTFDYLERLINGKCFHPGYEQGCLHQDCPIELNIDFSEDAISSNPVLKDILAYLSKIRDQKRREKEAGSD